MPQNSSARQARALALACPACRDAPHASRDPTRRDTRTLRDREQRTAAPSCLPGPRKPARRPVGFRRPTAWGEGCAGRGLGRRFLAMHAPSSSPGSKRSPPLRAPAPFPRWAQVRQREPREVLVVDSLPERFTNAFTLAGGSSSDATRRHVDRNDASFDRLASCGNRRFGALKHACGQSRGAAHPL